MYIGTIENTVKVKTHLKSFSVIPLEQCQFLLVGLKQHNCKLLIQQHSDIHMIHNGLSVEQVELVNQQIQNSSSSFILKLPVFHQETLYCSKGFPHTPYQTNTNIENDSNEDGFQYSLVCYDAALFYGKTKQQFSSFLSSTDFFTNYNNNNNYNNKSDSSNLNNDYPIKSSSATTSNIAMRSLKMYQDIINFDLSSGKWYEFEKTLNQTLISGIENYINNNNHIDFFESASKNIENQISKVKYDIGQVINNIDMVQNESYKVHQRIKGKYLKNHRLVCLYYRYSLQLWL